MSNPWNPGAREREIFAAALEALSGRGAGPAPAEAVAPLVARLAPADRLQLRILLRLLDYAPLFRRRWRRFCALPPEEREALLAGWAESRLAPWRQGAAALRALAMLARYGQEQVWAEVGYDGPWLGRRAVPLLPAPPLPLHPVEPSPPRTAAATRSPLAPGVTLGRTARGDLRLLAEVCVVGLGAGGAAALARLAARGLDVIAVEAGGPAGAADFDQRELAMLPLLYQEAGLRTTADKAIGILQGRGVGGSTLHNTGLVYAPPAGILSRWREEHGLLLGDDEMRLYVAAAMDALGAVPIPAGRINAANDALRRGAERLGWRYRVPLHNRAECSGCGYCMLGCAYNRKHHAALTLVPQAAAAGARILADAAARRIEGRAGARRVVCDLLDARGRPTGRRATIDAERVVVAAGALDTPALLQRSALGNPRVGRGLRLHPAAAVFAIFPQRMEAWRGVPQSVVVEEFASFQDDGRGGFLLIPNAATGPALTAVLLPGTGARHRAAMDRYPYLAAASVLLHDEGEGRVRAGHGGRPRARYRPGPADLAEIRRGVEALSRCYLAAGAAEVRLPLAGAPPVRDERDLAAALKAAAARPDRIPLNSVHPQGTCAFGSSPARGAVDPRGALRGAPGIYVADASLFPTSVGVPPQVTIMALAGAVADAVAEAR